MPSTYCLHPVAACGDAYTGERPSSWRAMLGAARSGVVQMNIADAKIADHHARQGYTYEATDWELYHWRSHADAVLSNIPWRGPCADLTSTVLDLLTRNGADLKDCYRLLVSSTGGDKPDHTVGCVLTGDGGMWIVGDTFNEAYPHHEMQHRGLEYNRLSEAGPNPIWREGNPWDVK